LNARAPLETASTRLPAWLDSWYIVALSKNVPKAGIIEGSLAKRPFIIFRSETGELAALDAHCPHMGTHLGSGKVIGERLRCPLHHWAIDRDGVLHGQGCVHRQTRKWVVAERFGLIFLHSGDTAPPPLPDPQSAKTFAWITGDSGPLETEWQALVVNGFDVLHMQAVHQRAMAEPPLFFADRENVLYFDYVTRVLPRGGLSSWIIKKLARNRIRVHQSCYGTIIVVESDLGRLKTAAVLGFLPCEGGVRAFGAFGTEPCGALWRLRLRLTRRFYLSFLRKDYVVLRNMRVKVDGIDDPGVVALRNYRRSLPVLKEDEAGG